MFNKWREAAKNFAAPPLAPPAPLGPPETPLHHWKLDEAAGTPKAADTGTSGTPVALTLRGDPAFLEGGGVALNGTDDYLDFGNGFEFAATNGFTFAAWVRHDAFQNSGNILFLLDGTIQNEIQLGNSGTTRRAHVYIKNSGTGKAFDTPDGSTDPADLFFPPAGQWAHVAWTVTTSGTFVLYRDGTTRDVWQKSDTVAATPSPIVYQTYAALGWGEDPYMGSQYFDGALRDARLYDRALSAAEIKHIFDYTKRG